MKIKRGIFKRSIEVDITTTELADVATNVYVQVGLLKVFGKIPLLDSKKEIK